jgi:hypothetical protein
MMHPFMSPPEGDNADEQFTLGTRGVVMLSR